MNLYVGTAIAGAVIVIAFIFSRYKKMTFKEYSKKYDDL
jgi:hypothetical protein